MNTFNSLVADIQKMGVEKGDVLFLRVSYKAIGSTDGGPMTFINALKEVIGKEGTLIVTAIHPRFPSALRFLKRNVIYTKEKPLKVRTGVIASMIASSPDAEFSAQASYPYVAIGKYAKEIIGNYKVDSKAYSIVVDMAENYDAKCLRIGGDLLTGTTHVAFSESLIHTNNFQRKKDMGVYSFDQRGQKKWMKATSSAFCYSAYKDFFYKYVENGSVISSGNIGNGEAMLFRMSATLEKEREFLMEKPQRLLCSDSRCIQCRSSYSYSDMSTCQFLLKELKFKLKRKKAMSMKKIFSRFVLVGLWGIKVK